MLEDEVFVSFGQLTDVVEDPFQTVLILVHVLRQIKVHDETDDEMAIKAVRESTVTRNTIGEVFDFEASFQAAGEEAAKWCNYCRKHSDNAGMNLCGLQLDLPQPCHLTERQTVNLFIVNRRPFTMCGLEWLNFYFVHGADHILTLRYLSRNLNLTKTNLN